MKKWIRRFRKFFELIGWLLSWRTWKHYYHRFCYEQIYHIRQLNKFAYKGKGVRIDTTASITHAERIYLDDYAHISQNSYVWARGDDAVIRLGKDVMMGPGVFILNSHHDYSQTNLAPRYQPDQSADVIIEDRVWLGAFSIILPGVTIGHDSVIAANSVVTKSVPPFSIVAGVPGKVVRSRLEEQQT